MQVQQPTKSSLQLKLELLRTLRTGDITQIHNLVSKIKTITKVNPQLYEKFNTFVSQNKQGLIQMQKEQKQENEQPKIIIENIDGQLDDDQQYNSNDSWSIEDSDQQQEDQKQKQKQKQRQKEKEKRVNNKSMTVLKQVNKTNTKIQAKQNINGNIKKDSVNNNNKQTPTNANLAFKKQSLKPSSSISSGVTRGTKSKN